MHGPESSYIVLAIPILSYPVPPYSCTPIDLKHFMGAHPLHICGAYVQAPSQGSCKALPIFLALVRAHDFCHA